MQVKSSGKSSDLSGGRYVTDLAEVFLFLNEYKKWKWNWMDVRI